MDLASRADVVSKARAHLDEWCKEIASSTELRTWYHHDPSLFEEFARRYRVELTEPGRATALTLWDRRAAVDFVSYRINPGTDSTTRGEGSGGAVSWVEVPNQLVRKCGSDGMSSARTRPR